MGWEGGKKCQLLALINNLVIQRNTPFLRKVTRNDVMEVSMRTYMLAIATAALFAIPTAAFSESMHVGRGGGRTAPSHHRYYNQYEGLYDRYESEFSSAIKAPA
jgi:hypothetical protein